MLDTILQNSLNDEKSQIWVFGYGSLVWKPNFSYAERIVGYVEGFERRFWQGSKHHRGTEIRPGRVVTLVERKNSRVWGVAYKVQGTENIQNALSHLKRREQALGCYETVVLNFYCRTEDEIKELSFPVIVYYAAPQNKCYLGAANNSQVSSDILFGFGESGWNVEYLFRLADFMREEVANVKDDHLFQVEELVRQKLGLCTQNIASWLELVECSNFLSQIKTKSQGNERNFVTA